jgi:hypothetical protein
MPLLEIALPGILLLTKALQKLVVGRALTLPDLIMAVLALPVDIVFLAASLLAGVAISAPGSGREGISIFALSLAISLLVVTFWRQSEKFFVQDQRWGTAILGLVNIFLSSAVLVFSLSLLSVGGGK